MVSKFKITKQELKRYFLIFIIVSIILLIGLTIDNLNWISGSPEWDSYHKVSDGVREWSGKVKDYTLPEKLDYALNYRIKTVWTNWRDISSALIFGLLITLIIIFSNEVLGKRVFHKKFIK